MMSKNTIVNEPCKPKADLTILGNLDAGQVFYSLEHEGYFMRLGNNPEYVKATKKALGNNQSVLALNLKTFAVAVFTPYDRYIPHYARIDIEGPCSSST